MTQHDTRTPVEWFLTLIAAGAFATIAFELYGEVISPLLGGSRLAPVPLAGSVWTALTGAQSREMANLLHYFAGVIGYPLGFALIARPIWKQVAPMVPWFVVAVAFGVVQWVFALYVMAHLIAGQAPFLNFTGITWAALYGHILYALVAVGFTSYFLVEEKID